VVVDLNGDRGVLVAEEPAVAAQDAELYGEAETLIVTTAAAHLCEILRGEHPIARELVVTEVGGDRRLHGGNASVTNDRF
jgi:hypothetical protein